MLRYQCLFVQELYNIVDQNNHRYRIAADTIKLLNAELAEMDVNNYKTDWIGPYLKDFANKKGIPFAALMKMLRSILSGVKVCTLWMNITSIMEKNIHM